MKRNVFLTGGSRGIGAAAVLALPLASSCMTTSSRSLSAQFQRFTAVTRVGAELLRITSRLSQYSFGFRRFMPMIPPFVIYTAGLAALPRPCLSF